VEWFLAVYMMIESKKGISANQLKRTLNVSYKTSWFLCHGIRAAMKDDEPQVLEEIVEIDKTYIGGKQSQDLRSTHYANKTMAMEAVQRGRAVRFRVERHAKQHSAVFFHKFVEDTLSDKAEHVYTDSTLLTRTSLRPIPATPASITKTRNGFGLMFKPTASSLFGRCSSGRSSAPTISFRPSTLRPT
jgi:hypothetical protein